MDLRSPLGKAKGLGAAKGGTHHWLMQRITALALIPLVIWFVILVIKSTQSDKNIVILMTSPFNTIAMILFLGTMLYHGALGLQVIFEDYVGCKCARKTLIIATNFTAIVTAVAVILAVVTMHVSHPKGHKKGYGKDDGVEANYLESDKHKRWKQEFFKIMQQENK